MQWIRELKFFLAAGMFAAAGAMSAADVPDKKPSPSVTVSLPCQAAGTREQPVRRMGGGCKRKLYPDSLCDQLHRTGRIPDPQGLRSDLGAAFRRGEGRKGGTGCGLGRDSGDRHAELRLGLHRKGRENRSARKIPDFRRRHPLLEKPRALHGKPYARERAVYRPCHAAVFGEILQSRQHARDGVDLIQTLKRALSARDLIFPENTAILPL